MAVLVTQLAARTDLRGSSFGIEVPFASVGECHVATIRPGAVRGNHFHLKRREVLIVLFSDRWTLLWDEGENTPVQSRAFEGSGAVLMDADPLCAHAVRNDGARDLQIFVLGDTRDADTHPRVLAQPVTRIAGVDGCRRGWVAVVKDGPSIEPRLCTSDEELLQLFESCAVVAIDVPIGLSERGPRSCDHHARRFLGRRASSVFPAPLRPLLALRDYAEANRVSNRLQQRGISKQGFAIVPKVEQVDRLLQRHQELRPRVYEVHPEVSFAYWNDGAALEPKRSAAALETRRALVRAHFGEVPPVSRGARENDLLDAFAALWTAERILAGRSQSLGDAHADQTGLPMRIVY
jgi:predicted RNase H-like nuclease